MIKIPFTPATFSQEAKERLSGINATIDFYNIQSALVKSATEIRKLLGNSTYDQIVDFLGKTELKEVESQALDNLKRAILHFAFYRHLVFMAVRIANDGVTTKKSDSETTAYKYLTDEIKLSLIDSAWFWMDQLFETIDSDPETFSTWKDSDQRKSITDLPITSGDFSFYYGIDSVYFFNRCTPLARKVMDEEITPRIALSALAIAEGDTAEVKKIKAETTILLKKAIVYKTLSMACRIFSYYELPSPLRASIDNEYSTGSSSGEDYVRNKLSGIIDTQAETMFVKIEAAEQRLDNKKNGTSFQPWPERKFNEDDNVALL